MEKIKSEEKPIIITKEECQGDYPAMEYAILKKTYGLQNFHWQLVVQSYRKEGDRKLDILKIRIIKDRHSKELLNPQIEKEILFELK